MNTSDTIRSLARIFLGAIVAFDITACGGSISGVGTGQMTLSVGDAPVDGAQKVVVEFGDMPAGPSTCLSSQAG
jgi:hypothetical protein